MALCLWRRCTVSSYVAIITAVLGICLMRLVARPLYSPGRPSSLYTSTSVCQNDLYFVPRSRSLVRTTSARRV